MGAGLQIRTRKVPLEMGRGGLDCTRFQARILVGVDLGRGEMGEEIRWDLEEVIGVVED